jgi:hypothetical protein
LLLDHLFRRIQAAAFGIYRMQGGLELRNAEAAYIDWRRVTDVADPPK